MFQIPPPETGRGSLHRLSWDSKYWGFPIAEFRSGDFSRAKIRDFLESCRQNKVRCAFLFLPARESARHCAWMRKAGANWIETRWLLSRSRLAPAYKWPTHSWREGWIRAAKRTDLAALIALTRQLHQNTRFFKDPRFPRSKAMRLYSIWIRRDYQKSHILVAVGSRRKAPLIGYVTCEILPEKIGRISLLGVREKYRGQGWGKRLTKAAVAWFRQRRCRLVQVITQGENRSAIGVYHASGFRMKQRDACFHAWF
jgi:ribosomal protein S18 acetylase RimI-like enzyme